MRQRNEFRATVWGGLIALAASLAPAQAPPAEPALGFNLVTNGSFEGDWYNTRPEVMGCPLEPRVRFGQADGYAEGWKLIDSEKPAAQQGAPVLRTAEGRSGRFAVRIGAGQSLTQEKIGYALATKAGFQAAPLRLSAWVKGSGGVTLRISLDSFTPPEAAGQPPVRNTFTFYHSDRLAVAGDWQRVTLDVPGAIIDTAVKHQNITGAIYATVALEAAGGEVLADDVRLERPHLAPSYTLVPNAGFEQLDEQGQPAQWSAPRKSLRHTHPTWYYIWRTWYHYMSVPRGENGVDGALAAAGQHSYRMNVPPGDEKYIESAAIALNQNAPTRMGLSFNYNAYLLHDLVIQVMDQDGQEVFFDHFAPGTTGGWHTYVAEFTPRPIEPKATAGGAGLAQQTGEPLPLRSCRVRIGVRGVNGSAHDDINEWVNVNHAGVLWFDNVALVELDSDAPALAARGTRTFELDQQAPPIVVESIDLGERLYGQNHATVTLLATGRSAANQEPLTLTVTGPFREDDPQKAGYAVSVPGQEAAVPPPKAAEQKASARVAVPPASRVTVSLPYRIDQLAQDWRSEYRVEVAYGQKKTHLTFGTWSQQALVEVLRSYAYPTETEQIVSMNLGVARPTLEQVRALNVEVRSARDDRPVLTQRLDDFAAIAARFNTQPLPEPPDPTGQNPPDPKNYGWQGDATNFHQVTLDISSLPIHPDTKPVRDHYVVVQGLGGDGKPLFEGRSPRFGRMQPHHEKLEPIQSVAIEDDVLLINGKPFFNRGHMQMQQNFGPSPMSHHPVDFKADGFNTGGNGYAAVEGLRTVKRGTTQIVTATDPDAESISHPEFIWRQNLYHISHTIKTTPPMDDATRARIQELISHPALIGVNFIQWEGHPEGGTEEERIQYANDIKALLDGRPLWLSAGWYSPTVNGVVYPCYLEHDFFAPESQNYFQPSHMDREIAPKKRARGEPFVLGNFPNVFNDLPWEIQRFELWTDIIQGHYGGYTIIGLPGDPTLNRGMNGEVRFLETFLFSKDTAPEVSVAPQVPHLVRAAGGKTYIMATNAGPVIGGDWKWNTQLKDQGKASHTGDAFWNRFHDFLKDYHVHFYENDTPVTLRKGDKIAQYVYLPPEAKIESVVLMARGNGDWMYQGVWGQWNHQQFTDSGVRLWLGKDMNNMFWGTVGFCGPDGGDPHHPNLLKYVYTDEQFHRLGALPEAGKWVRLEAPIESFGLAEGQLLDGFGYLSKGGHVWWERTLLVRDGQEIPLLDGAVGVPPEQLGKVRFNVPGLARGDKVKVVFEEREIVAEDGYFEDDLSGQPGYENIWGGIYGDKIGEQGYYGDGVFYNYNWGKIAARLYEIER